MDMREAAVEAIGHKKARRGHGIAAGRCRRGTGWAAEAAGPTLARGERNCSARMAIARTTSMLVAAGEGIVCRVMNR